MNTNTSLLHSSVEEKVVVCITPQSNSRRLIDKGAQIAQEHGGQLHILHVQKGNTIFQNQEALKWLEQLFIYGSEMGGMVHALCDEEIPSCIARFVKEEGVTKVVLGEVPKPLKKESAKSKKEPLFNRILNALPKEAQIIIVEREEKQQNSKREGWDARGNYSIA
ncbi:MAG: hypothetical protein GX299_02375 [Epulopiscium sp.]|jgi:K+-sensing histidine kinase KdpD|nr:hypothetical protein [Candidatus Epulonipiscium sp.]